MEYTYDKLVSKLNSTLKFIDRYTNVNGVRLYLTRMKEVGNETRDHKEEKYLNFMAYPKYYESRSGRIIFTFGVGEMYAVHNGLQDDSNLKFFLKRYGLAEFKKYLNGFSQFKSADETHILKLGEKELVPIWNNGRVLPPDTMEDDERLFRIADAVILGELHANRGREHPRSLDLIEKCFVPVDIYDYAAELLMSSEYFNATTCRLTSSGVDFYRRTNAMQSAEQPTEIEHVRASALISEGEGERIEFKSTLRWDVRKNSVNHELEAEVLKAVAAFSNSKGGHVLIGVKNNGKLLGLSNDYATFRSAAGNKDTFELHIRNILQEHFGQSFAATSASASFPILDGKEICVLLVRPDVDPVFLGKTGKQVFYVRSGNSSRRISDLNELSKYIRQRFK